MYRDGSWPYTLCDRELCDSPMTAEHEEASAFLADIAVMERRTREFLTYSKVSQSFLLWGAIWFAGYTGQHFFRAESGVIWTVLNVSGIAVSIVLGHRGANRFQWRVPVTVLLFIGFGMLWLTLGHFGWREQAAFWPTLFSFALILFGMWVGRALIAAAVLLTLLTLTGYWLAGNFYDLWMAAIGGGALIGIGLWLRS